MNPRLDDLIALAALGELTDAESAELDAAARSDPDVAAQLTAALATAAALQGSARRAPPTALRASVLDAITAVTQDPAPPAHSVAPVIPFNRARRRWLAPLTAAAAGLLVVAGTVAIVASNDAGLNNSNDSVAAVVEADDASTRSLVGSLGDSLVVVFSPSENALAVVGTVVPQLDADETYQLWLINDSAATSVGIFRPDDTGAVSVRFGEANPTEFSLGVTREPSGGSKKPSLPLLGLAKMDA